MDSRKFTTLCGGIRVNCGVIWLLLPSAEAMWDALPYVGGNVQILTRRVVFSDLLNHSLIQSFHSFDPNAVWTAFV